VSTASSFGSRRISTVLTNYVLVITAAISGVDGLIS
jgi:hypothetical protein